MLVYILHWFISIVYFVSAVAILERTLGSNLKDYIKILLTIFSVLLLVVVSLISVFQFTLGRFLLV